MVHTGAVEQVPNYTNLYRRGAVYYFRARIPASLRKAFGRAEWKESLGTKDFETAKGKWREAQARFHARCTAALDRIEADAASGRPLAEFTKHELQQIVLDWFHSLKTDEEGKAGAAGCTPQTRLDRSEAERQLRDDIEELADPDSPYEDASVQSIATRLLVENGARKQPRFANEAIQSRAANAFSLTDTDRETAQFRLVVNLVRRASLEFSRLSARRLGGDYSEEISDALFTEGKTAQRGTLSLKGLIKDFEAERTHKAVSEKTRLANASTFNALIDYYGKDYEVSKFDRVACRSFRDAIVRLPRNARQRYPDKSIREIVEVAPTDGKRISPTTVNHYLGDLRQLLQFAVDNGWLARNPANGLTVRNPVRKADRRSSFSDDQLRAIFGSSFFEETAQLPAADPKPAMFYVPLIGLFSGMRLNEICQLRVNDVAQVEGVWCFLVAHAEDQRAKTEASRRLVPVHRRLIEFGILEHRKALERQGATPPSLFPDVPKAATGYYSDVFSKRFSRFIHKLGARRSGTGFHCFRHTFRDACRNAGVSSEAARALGGWSAGTTDANYGSQMRVSVLQREINKIGYDHIKIGDHPL